MDTLKILFYLKYRTCHCNISAFNILTSCRTSFKMKYYAADECRDNLKIAQSSGETLPYEFYIQESGCLNQTMDRSFSLFTIIFRRIHSHFISRISPSQLCCKLYSTAVKHHPFFNHTN